MELQILQSLAETTRALAHLSTLMAYLLALLTVVTLVGFACMGLQLRAMQASVERIAQLLAPRQR